jgi:putative oxidoreductase
LLDFWRYSGLERRGLRSAFITNIAIVGGLLLVATAGGA